MSTTMLFAQRSDLSLPVSLDVQDTQLKTVLDEISDQTDLYFSYNPALVDDEVLVTYTCDKRSLEVVLEELQNQTQLDFNFIEGQVVITPIDESDLPVFMLTGYLSDSLSGQTLIYGNVSLDNGESGTTTNEYGYFALPIRQGHHRVTFSYVGYDRIALDIDMQQHESLNIALPSSAADLPTVEIESSAPSLDHQDLGQIQLTSEDVQKLPEFAGESSLIKNMESLPGVKQHSEISSFFFVRGGERDQNIIIVDDAPIYNPSHLLGFSSIVLPDFVSKIDVYKSDMPANVGDRLASIVSVRTRDGNLNKFSMSGALNPFVNRVTVEIPVIKQRSSIFASYRRSALELLYGQSNQNIDYFFQDFHFKWNYRPNDKNRFFITVLASGDDYKSTTGQIRSLEWGNFAATFRWNKTFGPRLFSNTTLYTGNYAYNLNFPPNLWKSELGTLSLKSDFTHYISDNITSKFGVEAQGYFNNPGRFSLDSTNAILPNITRNYGRKLVAHYQSKLNVTPKLQLTAGVRLINWANLGPDTYYNFNEQGEVVEQIDVEEGVYNSYLNLDPRISLQYNFKNNAAIKASYGIYHQYLQLISNSISPFTAMEIYLTAGPNIKPQKSTQWALNYSKRWPKQKTSLSLASYYKTSENQIDYSGHANIYLNDFLEAELHFGTSEAYGFEMQLARNFGKLDATLAYTYSRVFRLTPTLNQGREYAAFQDRPHDVSLAFGYKFSDRFEAQGYWTSFTGSPFTAPTGFYQINGQTIPIYDERNNERLPAYHRLDLSCTFRLNKNLQKRFQHELTLSIFNVTANRNVYAIKFNKLDDNELFPEVPSNRLTSNLLSPSQVELAQFFPSLTYKFKL